MKRWKDAQYLRNMAGNRTVPVEVGENYLEEGWGQKLVLLSDFIAEHLADKASSTCSIQWSQISHTEMHLKSERACQRTSYPLIIV